MDIGYIKTFIAVYRQGSFAKVANDQNVAASSVSRAIGSLERTLATRLFQRTTRRVEPTQAGAAYFEKVAPLIEELEFAHQSLIDHAIKPSGTLRVTASTTFGQVILAPMLGEFRTRYPHIKLELILSDGQLQLVDERIDLAIRHGQLPDSTLVARKLADVNYTLVASSDYLKSYGTPQWPKDLADHELIAFSYENFRSAWTFDANGDPQSLAINPAITATSAATIRECAREGAGIALLPQWTIRTDLASGRLIELMRDHRVRGESESGAIWLIYPSRRYVPAKARVFVEFLMQHNEDLV